MNDQPFYVIMIGSGILVVLMIVGLKLLYDRLSGTRSAQDNEAGVVTVTDEASIDTSGEFVEALTYSVTEHRHNGLCLHHNPMLDSGETHDPTENPKDHLLSESRAQVNVAQVKLDTDTCKDDYLDEQIIPPINDPISVGETIDMNMDDVNSMATIIPNPDQKLDSMRSMNFISDSENSLFGTSLIERSKKLGDQDLGSQAAQRPPIPLLGLPINSS